MLMVRNILVALLCVSPLCLFWDGLIVQGLVSGIASLALPMTARSLRPGETDFLISVVRPALIAAAIPALWVAVQILPFGIFAHPIWRSASAALHEPMLGSISVDPAASIISLGDYMLLAAVAFLSSAVAVDRQRAEWVLFALSIATTIAGLIVIGHQFVSRWPTPFAFSQATECVSLGTIIAATSCARAIERYRVRRYQSRNVQQLSLTDLLSFIPGAAALVICGLAVLLVASREAIFGTAYGLLTLASQVIIRRFGLGWWGIAGVAIPALGIAIILIGSYPAQRDVSAPLAFASGAFSPYAALSQRMMDDAPLGGIGAGTFNALAPVYRQSQDPPSGPTAATAAAAFAIELGKPMLWLMVTATGAFTLALLRASLQRGRDSFYAAMAASGLVTTLLFAFIDAGLFGTGTGLIVSAMLGLGLAQSRSRTVHV
jgi:hypothetical protein